MWTKTQNGIVGIKANLRKLVALPPFHIPRTLMLGDREIQERDLLAETGVVIVLAEPGAGKTALLASLGARFGVAPVKASIFERVQASCLIVDAFDEVARIDLSGLHRTLRELRHTGSVRTILSSRSSEWSDAETHLVRDLMGADPMVARLVALDDAEQAQLFRHHHPTADFAVFRAELACHDLTNLIGNPEFLMLFAGAFIEAGGAFPNRQAIFGDAVQYLAREANKALPATRDAPTAEQRIAWADEVHARLLLSGSDGVSTTGPAEARAFPRLANLGLPDPRLPSILDTRLFRPAAGADRHEPVHRIVAEHCAARALVKRIGDPTNTFTMKQCLSIVTPNGATRDDLRGLLGWMAALGNQDIQDAAIEVDPYAVLSNGDPSLLTVRSRHRLLNALRDLEADNPFFRRADRRRSFNAAGFFPPDIVDAIRPLIARDSGGDLRTLLLELLAGSPAVPALRADLELIILDDNATPRCRQAALNCLLTDATQLVSLIDPLIASGTTESLRLSAAIINRIGANQIPRQQLGNLLIACAALYPTGPRDRHQIIGSRYFIRVLVRDLDGETTSWLLDEITQGMSCTCGARAWECNCRTGRSKIAGHLLDRYFEIYLGPHDPSRIWAWVKGLHFHSSADAKDSPAIRVLQEDAALRQAIQRLKYEGLKTHGEMLEASMDRQDHAGLATQRDDIQTMMDHAFATDNVELWSWFTHGHQFYAGKNERGPDALRQHARRQAIEKPAFLARWSLRQRGQFDNWKVNRDRRFRYQARWRRRDRKGAEDAVRSLTENRELIEAGQHWGWLSRIAQYYLIQPAELDKVTHGLIDVEAALRNSLRTVGDDIPTLKQCALQTHRGWEITLHAACIAEFRATGDLAHVDRRILMAVRTDSCFYDGAEEEERRRFEQAIDALLFTNEADADAFITSYFEALFAAGDLSPDVSWLERYTHFQFLLPTRPLDWLRRFPSMSDYALDGLFDLAFRHGDRAGLLNLIRERCAALDTGILPHRHEAQRRFWFLRHFWFLDEDQTAVWSTLARDPNFIFELERLWHGQRRNDTSWPDLDAAKIACILDTFIDRWPPVPLPPSWGTGSPPGETAYRYLHDVVYAIGRDRSDAVIPILDGLLADPRMSPFHDNLRSIRAESRRALSLRAFRPPSVTEIREALDAGRPASVEHMRQIMIDFLDHLQAEIHGGDLGVINQFYENGKRISENEATKRIVNWLRPRLEPLGFIDVIEHHLANDKRCDITACVLTPVGRKMLVIEVKGQWNNELFTAAECQLSQRYSIHPTAEDQGIYLVLWFGAHEPIAGKKSDEIKNASDLRELLTSGLPAGLVGKVDVVVLDLTKQGGDIELPSAAQHTIDDKRPRPSKQSEQVSP